MHRKKERDLFVGSLPKFLQQLRLGQTESGNLEFNLHLQHGWEYPNI